MRYDLKKCDLLTDWWNIAQDRGAWRCLVKDAGEEMDDLLEAYEKEKEDIRKKRREDGTPALPSALKCEELGRSLAGQTTASLVNHIRKRHGSITQL